MITATYPIQQRKPSSNRYDSKQIYTNEPKLPTPTRQIKQQIPKIPKLGSEKSPKITKNIKNNKNNDATIAKINEIKKQIDDQKKIENSSQNPIKKVNTVFNIYYILYA